MRIGSLTNDAYIKSLILELGELIEDAQRQVAVTANAALTTLYWQVGRRVRTEVLEGRRAEYGVKLVATLGHQLQSHYGRSFGEKSLHHMIRFAEAFPDAEIVSALRTQLSWSHFKQLIYIPDELKRNFYAEMCRTERWSTRLLARKVGGMLYGRKALSKKPEEIIRRELAALREKGDVSPPRREMLQERLRRAIKTARSRLALGSNLNTEISLPTRKLRRIGVSSLRK